MFWGTVTCDGDDDDGDGDMIPSYAVVDDK